MTIWAGVMHFRGSRFCLELIEHGKHESFLFCVSAETITWNELSEGT